MEVAFSNSFKKVLKKYIIRTEIEAEFWLRLGLFIDDPFNPKLKTHKLSGKLRNLWSFSVTKDLRVVFFFTNEKSRRAVFIDIGTHDEVY
jgi:mRNA-degrading endonuclease YafQ of YafQ-DinJ toxin-antitoxin module